MRLEDLPEGIERRYEPDDRRFLLVEFWPAGLEPSDEVTWSQTACGMDRLSIRLGETIKKVSYSAAEDRLWLDGCDPEAPAPIFPLRPETGGQSPRVSREPTETGQMWQLNIERPEIGVLEDIHIVIRGLPALLALQPEGLLRPRDGNGNTTAQHGRP